MVMALSLQHSEADVPELAGSTCERLLSVQSRRVDGSIVPGLFWLKIQAGRWHRFFIDAGVLHWQEQDDIDDWGNEPDFPLLDAGAQYRLDGSKIAGVSMRQTPDDVKFNTRLTISFTDGRALVVQHSEDDSRISLIECGPPLN